MDSEEEDSVGEIKLNIVAYHEFDIGNLGQIF